MSRQLKSVHLSSIEAALFGAESNDADVQDAQIYHSATVIISNTTGSGAVTSAWLELKD